MPFDHVVNHRHVVVALRPGHLINTEVLQAGQQCRIERRETFLQVRPVDLLHRLPAYPQMPGDSLNTHVAAQATDHATEATGETPSRVNKLTALYPPFVLADTYLGQLHFNHAGIAKQRHIPDLSADIPVDRSLLLGNGVYGFSAPVPAAANDELSLLLVQFYLIDALPLEAQNIPLDVDSHIPVPYKVVIGLIYQQITWGSASFFTHRTGEEPLSKV